MAGLPVPGIAAQKREQCQWKSNALFVNLFFSQRTGCDPYAAVPDPISLLNMIPSLIDDRSDMIICQRVKNRFSLPAGLHQPVLL